MSDNTIGQLVLLVTTILGFLITGWRENRNRKWAAEDRRLATAEIVAEAKAEAEVTRIKNEIIADNLRTAALVDAAKVHAKLDEAQTAAHVAYKEANDVNVKIANLNERLLKQVEKDS